MNRGVIVRTLINGMCFDGSATDPMQQAIRDALIAFMAAMAQAQAEATKIAQQTGIAHVKQAGGYLGRKPTFRKEQVEQALAMKSADVPITTIARTLCLSRQTVYRICGDPDEAMKIASQWQSG